MYKHLTISIITALLFILKVLPLMAIGDVGVGINIGITHDPNNLESEINKYNENMEAYKTANSGTELNQINVPYSPVLGVNFRYNFNYLLFRIGGYYTRAYFYKAQGNIKISGTKNKIKIDSYQAGFPGSICLLVPLKKRTISYIGGGMNLHFTYLKISQTNPGAGIVSPDDSVNRYSGMFAGFHIIFGIEFPLTNRYTLTGEWIHQMGSSPMIKSEDTADERSFNVNSDYIMFGINYYISI